MSQVFHNRKSPISPQSYGKSHLLQAQHFEISTKNATSINFIHGNDLPEEHVYENTSICIEKTKVEQEPIFYISEQVWTWVYYHAKTRL